MKVKKQVQTYQHKVKRGDYMQSRVFTYPNATVRVHIPDLANGEREKRLNEIKRSAEILLKGVIKNGTKEKPARNDT